MVAALRERGIDGATVLEVGAGAGTAIASMLEAGATAAVGVDISPNYEATAREFLDRRGLGDSVRWRTGDFVALAADLPVSDVVFLNRVVCCYPDMPDLVDAAAGRSQGLLAMSFPRRRLLSRIVVKTINLWLRINRNSFRVFVHDPAEIEGRIDASGFGLVASGQTPGWRWGVWARGVVAPG